VQLPESLSNILIHVLGDEREQQMAHAVEHGFGVHVTDFHLPELLDDAAACGKLVAWFRERLPAVRGVIAFHGAFVDLHPTAADSKMLGATRDRVQQTLDIAEEIGVELAVYHCEFDAMNLNADYLSVCAERHATFWQDVMKGRALSIALENIREPRPEITKTLVDAVGLETVGVCLDLGHLNVRSAAPPAEWVEALGARITCLHLHDNDGSADQHLPVGKGTVDWAGLAGALARHGLRPPAVAEITSLESQRASLEFLAAMDQ